MKFKSAKLIGAEGRKRKEEKFLLDLSVRSDDPDAVLNDDGDCLSVRSIVKFSAETIYDAGIKFFVGDREFFQGDIENSLRVISECSAVIKKLTNQRRF